MAIHKGKGVKKHNDRFTIVGAQYIRFLSINDNLLWTTIGKMCGNADAIVATGQQGMGKKNRICS